jgi:hypothetical protein
MGDTMLSMNVSWLGVLIAAAASFAIGMFWYSPAGFGKQWMKLVGLSTADMEKAKKKGMGKTMGMAAVTQLVTAFVLAHFVIFTGSTSWLDGAQTGFWLWLGFMATKSLGMVLWENKPKELYFLNIGHDLVGMLVMGAILAVL